MGSVSEYKVCKCGSEELFSDYYYKTDELYESCDVCGYYHTAFIKNRPTDGKYPEGWKPEYDEKEGATGYVVKVFAKEGVGHSVACVEEKDVEGLIGALETDQQVKHFGITYKNAKGFYQTQLFKV